MKRHALPPGAVTRARRLRREMTDAERVLWRGLREQFPDAHFRHQVPLGRYYADFASHGLKLVVEADCGQHGGAVDYDAARTGFLNGEGYRVLRFWNNDILGNLDGVLTAIAAAIPQSLSPLVGERLERGVARRSRARAKGAHPHPSPPHKGEGEIYNSRPE